MSNRSTRTSIAIKLDGPWLVPMRIEESQLRGHALR